MNSNNLITFEYIHCEKEAIEKHEASFVEDEFRTQLTKLFQTQLTIQSVNIKLKYEEHNPKNPFSCSITVIGDRVNFQSNEEGTDPASITRRCIHKAINHLHEIKDKSTQ